MHMIKILKIKNRKKFEFTFPKRKATILTTPVDIHALNTVSPVLEGNHVKFKQSQLKPNFPEISGTPYFPPVHQYAPVRQKCYVCQDIFVIITLYLMYVLYKSGGN